MKSPAFQFYPDDFLGSPTVARMSHAEIGVYMMLLCLDWNGDGLPEDIPTLARMVKIPAKQFARMWETLGACFPVRDGRRYNPRLEKERAKQEEWRAKSSAGGKKGAAARWHTDTDTVGTDKGGHKGGHKMVITTASPNDDTPVSSLQSPSNTKQPSAYPAEFERAFQAMPKRAGGHPKKTAFRAWSASLKRGADPAAIEDGARRYALFIAAIGKTGTEFVKLAATFFGPDDLWLDAWDVPLTVTRGGRPEPQYTDPTAPGYVGLVNGWMSPELERMTRP